MPGSNSKAKANAKQEEKQKQQLEWEELEQQKIKKDLSKDKIVQEAIRNFPGMRILRQDPFQCYISFIVSSNSNILIR